MRVLIVEDEVKTVRYLTKGLSENGYFVEHALDGEDGLHLAEIGNFDAIILDSMLPRLSGIGLLNELRRSRQTPVIMLTARDDISDRLQGLGAGADDYLVKPFSFLELLARLQAIMRRGDKEILEIQVADLRIDILARRATRAGQRLHLTAKEFGVLMELARRQGQIVSKTALAELVWGINFDTNTNVVEVTVKRLRAKIEAPGSARLLHTVRSMGYVFESRADAA